MDSILRARQASVIEEAPMPEGRCRLLVEKNGEPPRPLQEASPASEDG